MAQGDRCTDSPRLYAQVNLNSAYGSLVAVPQPVRSVGGPAEADDENSGIVGPSCPAGKTMSVLERRRLSMKLPEIRAGRPVVAASSLLQRRAQTRQARRQQLALNVPKIAIDNVDVHVEEDLWQGQYNIMETTARTAASKVQRAIRSSDGKEVALKTMWSNELEILYIAIAEFKALQRMDHVNIIKAYDLHTVGGRAVLVMDYFDGATLDHAVRHTHGHFSEAQSRAYAVQLFDAVAHVHARGIIHRDIKPENTLVSLERKRMMLIDFNTACDWSQENLAVVPAGTQLYMAPEEVRGNPSTPASDVWGVAVCVFLMLAGKLPQGRHRCEHQEALEVAAEQEVKFEGKHWGKVSDPCKSCLSRCLAVDELARPQANVALTPWIFTCDDECDAGLPIKLQPPKEASVTENAFRNSVVLDDDCLDACKPMACAFSLNDPRVLVSYADGIEKRCTADVPNKTPNHPHAIMSYVDGIQKRDVPDETKDRFIEDPHDHFGAFDWSRFGQALMLTGARPPARGWAELPKFDADSCQYCPAPTEDCHGEPPLSDSARGCEHSNVDQA